MDYPSWITPPNLGSFLQDYSFNLNPIIIQFSAGIGSVISEINGGLPEGLFWERSGQTIKILGVASQTTSDINSRITFRITQTNGAIADRTFFIVLTDIPIPPSWEFQNTLLGYQNNTLPQSYQMRAVGQPGEHVIYSIFSPGVASGNVNVSTSIGSQTGLLVCDASNVIVNSTVSIGVRATTKASSDIDVFVEVIVDTTAPQWITPPGTLGTFSSNDFIELNLLAEDPNDLTVTYALSSNPQNLPIDIASSGLLYGRMPIINEETTYSIIASATNGSLTSFRTFTITVLPSTDTSLLIWETDSNLGPINEGEIVQVQIRAISRRGNLVKYNISGGVVPPHLQIGTTTGLLVGFCEYTAVPKTYNFDVMATDGSQTIFKQFSLSVRKIYGDQYFSTYIPVTGGLKDLCVTDIGNIQVRVPQTNTFNKLTNQGLQPAMVVINGVITGYDTAAQIIQQSQNWLNQLDLQFGNVSNTSISSGSSVIYRNMFDYQSGSNAVVYSQAVYNTNVQTGGLVYPISLNNIRNSLIAGRSYVNSGSGSGASLSPILNWSTGSLTGVQIINTGTGYTSPPTVIITGSGTGAQVRAVLGVVSLSITDSGQGWALDDEILIDTGIYLIPARLTVTEIGTNGSLVNFRIEEPGDYTQIPYTTNTFIGSGNKQAKISPIWGISSVTVINGGSNYQNGISFSTEGTELLPWWQKTYSPVIYMGNVAGISGSAMANALNVEQTNTRMWGTRWQPNYMVFQWQGLKWNGTTTFDDELTTFDGGSTNFEETNSPTDTIFDQNLTTFDNGNTVFDTPQLTDQYLYYTYGSVEPMDMYSTLIDIPATQLFSNTMVRRWIRRNNKVYSGNNFVY